MKFTLEIDLPEIDESKWECKGYDYLKKGNFYLDMGKLTEWTIEERSYVKALIFHPKYTWKENISWPQWLKPGYIARSKWNSGKNPSWYSSYPKYDDLNEVFCGEDQTDIGLTVDISFLPKEFWTCSCKDSLVEVKHEN